MPTANGKLKGGDRLRFRNKDGTIEVEAIVFERLGNDSDYGVVLKRADGKEWPPSPSVRLGDRRLMVLYEAPYYVFVQQGGWELV